MVFLLGAPGVDIFGILRVYVNEDVKQTGKRIVLGKLFIDVEQMLELVLMQCSTGCFPVFFHFCWRNGPEADGPAFEDDDVYWRLVGLVYGDPLRLGEAVALAGKGGFVVLGDLGWGAAE